MSDPVNKPRQPVDLDEFERRLRGAESSYQPQAFGNDPYAPPVATPQAYGMAPAVQPQMQDPLAELARIVDGGHGQNFGAPAQAQGKSDPYGQPGDWGLQGSAGEPHPDLRGGYYGQDPIRGADQSHDPYGSAPYVAQPAYGSSWPNEDREWMDAPEGASEPRRSRKKALLMGAALLVVAGGVVGTFAMRSGPAGRSDVPTIKAAQGPMKVTPEPAPASQEPSRTASVLERAPEKLGSSKVISNEEQPVDLSQVKASPAAPAPAAAAKSAFPEPIRVKTVSVRPDGSIVTTMPTPAPAPVAAPTPAPAPRQTSAALPTASTATPAAAPPPAPAASAAPPTPPQKMTERAVSNPLPVTPPAASAERRMAGATPATPAATTPAANAPAASGGYAVQFSAAGSENEAREKIAATQRRFGDALSGRVPTFVKGEAAGRTVWRVRVGGMTREEASSMCQRIKGQGGDCFVAAN